MGCFWTTDSLSSERMGGNVHVVRKCLTWTWPIWCSYPTQSCCACLLSRKSPPVNLLSSGWLYGSLPRTRSRKVGITGTEIFPCAVGWYLPWYDFPLDRSSISADPRDPLSPRRTRGLLDSDVATGVPLPHNIIEHIGRCHIVRPSGQLGMKIDEWGCCHPQIPLPPIHLISLTGCWLEADSWNFPRRW